MTTLPQLRRIYHNEIGIQIVRFAKGADEPYPNLADGSSRSSVLISNGIAEILGFSTQSRPRLSGQTAGALFEKLTCDFLREAFEAIRHLRPGRWEYLTTRTQISRFVQYRHLETLDALVSDNQTLSAALGHGYIVTPDIVVARLPCDARRSQHVPGVSSQCGPSLSHPVLGERSDRSSSLPARQCVLQVDHPKRPVTEHPHRGAESHPKPQGQPAAHRGGNGRTSPDANCLPGPRDRRPGLRVSLRLGRVEGSVRIASRVRGPSGNAGNHDSRRPAAGHQ